MLVLGLNNVDEFLGLTISKSRVRCQSNPARRIEIQQRFIPTCVGKTFKPERLLINIVEHPHGRGEDGPSMRDLITMGETPPRAWGRRDQRKQGAQAVRNTPTGVGKTTAKRV